MNVLIKRKGRQSKKKNLILADRKFTISTVPQLEWRPDISNKAL
jgi:hypothetical protein